MPRSRSASKKDKSGWQAALRKAAARRAKGIAATLAAAERKDQALMLKALKRSQRLERTAEHRRMVQRMYDERPRRTNPTKAQKREKVRKASVQRRVASALAKFLHQANPAMKTSGAMVTRLKGGVLKITPIKANPGGLKRVLSEYTHQRRGGSSRLGAVRRAIGSTRKNPKRRSR
jgi:phytoene dehydrogenase-like protein